MRCLKRNQQVFYYYLYKGRVVIRDSDNNETGEYTFAYHRPVECRGNISAGSGDAQVELFGTSITFNKVILIDDLNCPIDTATLLCVDIIPKRFSAGETPSHDYVVKSVARSLNSVSIAISKVDADENNA